MLLHRDLVDVLPHWGLVRTEDAWLALREWGYFDGADNQLVLQYSISRYHEYVFLRVFVFLQLTCHGQISRLGPLWTSFWPGTLIRYSGASA